MLELFLSAPLTLWVFVLLPVFYVRVWLRHKELANSGDYRPLPGGRRLWYIIFDDWVAMLTLLVLILAFLAHLGKLIDRYYWF